MDRRTLLRLFGSALVAPPAMLVGPPFMGGLPAQTNSESIATTRAGQWRGRSDAGIHLFKGIRYGAASSPFMGALDRGEVIASYRQWHPDYSPVDVFFSATTDSRSWRGQVIESDRRAAQPAGSAPTCVFQFDWPTPVDGGKWKAHHGLDVPFIFDNVEITPHFVGAGEAQRRLAARMSSAWIAFARTGNPNVPGIAEWPAFELKRRATMVFDNEVRIVADPRGRERRMFGQVPYVQPGR